MANQYCVKCGTQMIWQPEEGRQREVCPACGYIHYLHLKVAVAAQIELGGQLLLLKRAQDPWKGYWNLPAGYVEVDESLEDAVKREVWEETGYMVRVEELVGNYFFDDDPRGNGILLVFRAVIVSGDLHPNHESAEITYFSWDTLPMNICGAGHLRAVASWQNEKQS